jgi:hypothetical protein
MNGRIRRITISIFLLTCGLAASCAIAAFFAFRPTESPAAAKLAASVHLLELPKAFQSLRPGMTQSDIVAAVGQPKSKAMNAKFVRKSPSEWAEMERQAHDLATANSDPNAAPDLRMLKINAELQHRTKEIWTYQPTEQIYDILSFDEQGRLIKSGTGIVDHGTPKKP